MNLTKQIHVYSLDTACFYNDREAAIHKKMLRFYKILHDIETSQKNIIHKRHQHKRVSKILERYKHLLTTEFKATKAYNINHNKVRHLRPEALIDKNVVSIFESFLTRTLGCEINKLTEDIMIIQVFFFEIAEDIIKQGFIHQGERYVLFGASAGQIRTKKLVVIRESVLKQHEKTLMCGLNVDIINAKGGINVNKYLAYYALANSATEEWKEFDIDKAIVVEDFETMVRCEVDFIDDVTYEIKRQTMDVPIPHMDGAGLILNGKTTMCRLPWIKGLLINFDFRRFIREHWANVKSNSGIVKDIYGDEHDILKEDIKYIFTKSQFKLYKYYDSWKQYKNYYKRYKCSAGKINEEEGVIPNARINYQMLQTLTDVTKREMGCLAKETLKEIELIGNDFRTTMQLLNATEDNEKPNYMQKILQIYPELMRDSYNRKMLKDTQKSLVKQAKAGRLRVNGKYTFVAPDVYAFCEWLFLGENNPKGLIANGEVSCNLFEDGVELDCLRSPHLTKEHAVRRNVVNSTTKEWFDSKCVYTSVFDNCSKLLQFD